MFLKKTLTSGAEGYFWILEVKMKYFRGAKYTDHGEGGQEDVWKPGSLTDATEVCKSSKCSQSGLLVQIQGHLCHCGHGGKSSQKFPWRVGTVGNRKATRLAESCGKANLSNPISTLSPSATSRRNSLDASRDEHPKPP